MTAARTAPPCNGCRGQPHRTTPPCELRLTPYHCIGPKMSTPQVGRSGRRSTPRTRWSGRPWLRGLGDDCAVVACRSITVTPRLAVARGAAGAGEEGASGYVPVSLSSRRSRSASARARGEGHRRPQRSSARTRAATACSCPAWTQRAACGLRHNCVHRSSSGAIIVAGQTGIEPRRASRGSGIRVAEMVSCGDCWGPVRMSPVTSWRYRGGRSRCPRAVSEHQPAKSLHVVV